MHKWSLNVKILFSDVFLSLNNSHVSVLLLVVIVAGVV